MPQYPFCHLGSVSHGTMLAEDLIQCFESILEELDSGAYEEYQKDYPPIDQWSDLDDDRLEALFNALDDAAPPYVSFGASEGDGADYGFWLCHESLEEAVCDGEVVRVDAGDERTMPEDADATYFLEVNDHGNMTLFCKDGTEVWSCV